jgi:hypothetical protein
LVFDEGGQLTDAVIELTGGFVKVLGIPIDGWCAIVVCGLINSLDQFTAYTRSAHGWLGIKILKLGDILSPPVVGVKDIMHQSDQTAIGLRHECVLMRTRWVDQTRKCGVVKIIIQHSFVKRQIPAPQRGPFVKIRLV